MATMSGKPITSAYITSLMRRISDLEAKAECYTGARRLAVRKAQFISTNQFDGLWVMKSAHDVVTISGQDHYFRALNGMALSRYFSTFPGGAAIDFAVKNSLRNPIRDGESDSSNKYLNGNRTIGTNGISIIYGSAYTWDPGSETIVSIDDKLSAFDTGGRYAFTYANSTAQSTSEGGLTYSPGGLPRRLWYVGSALYDLQHASPFTEGSLWCSFESPGGGGSGPLESPDSSDGWMFFRIGSRIFAGQIPVVATATPVATTEIYDASATGDTLLHMRADHASATYCGIWYLEASTGLQVFAKLNRVTGAVTNKLYGYPDGTTFGEWNLRVLGNVGIASPDYIMDLAYSGGKWWALKCRWNGAPDHLPYNEGITVPGVSWVEEYDLGNSESSTPVVSQLWSLQSTTQPAAGFQRDWHKYEYTGNDNFDAVSIGPQPSGNALYGLVATWATLRDILDRLIYIVYMFTPDRTQVLPLNWRKGDPNNVLKRATGTEQEEFTHLEIHAVEDYGPPPYGLSAKYREVRPNSVLPGLSPGPNETNTEPPAWMGQTFDEIEAILSYLEHSARGRYPVSMQYHHSPDITLPYNTTYNDPE